MTGYLLASYPGLTPELGILAGTLTATLVGAGFGLLAIRRQGIYFAMVTLALAQLVYFVFVQAPLPGEKMACMACHGGICSASSACVTT